MEGRKDRRVGSGRGWGLLRWTYAVGCLLVLVGYFVLGGPDDETGRWLWFSGWLLVGGGLLGQGLIHLVRRRTGSSR